MIVCVGGNVVVEPSTYTVNKNIKIAILNERSPCG